MKAQYDSIVGEREKELNRVLESMKVVQQAYHGNVMVGNHCIIVLKHFCDLTAVIREKVELCNSYNELFTLFSEIMHYSMERRFLMDDEIMKVVKLCHQFGEVFPMNFPYRNITRKMHELIFNVPLFIKKYKTIGMLSEQEGESKHASINAELRSLSCVRSHSERIRLVLEKEELRATMDKSQITPKPRLCVNWHRWEKTLYLL